jgi:acyl carrier protein
MLVVMGRADTQLKVRGHRVEPAEVEAALLASPGISAAAVAERRDRRGQPWLTAYVVRADTTLTATALRRALATRLPDYMVPQRVAFVEAIPVTVNGKVDWYVLPEPSSARPDLATPWVAARSPIEALLVGVWQEVLSVDTVGVHDSFADLGGDSLAAVKIVTRLEHRLGDLPVRELLERAASVDAMATLLVPALLARLGSDAVSALIGELGRDPRA